MKIELVSHLALHAGLNSDKKAADYFQIHEKTWKKKRKANQLKISEWDALKSRAGFIVCPGWEDFKICGDRLYSTSGHFVTANEVENMWLYRQILSAWKTEIIVPDERHKPLLRLV